LKQLTGAYKKAGGNNGTETVQLQRIISKQHLVRLRNKPLLPRDLIAQTAIPDPKSPCFFRQDVGGQCKIAILLYSDERWNLGN